MSRILVSVTPLVGHVGPMIAVAAFLSMQGHDVIFNTSDLFREKVEAAGLHFLPLLGNANYDYRKLGELIPELRMARSATDQINCYLTYMFGDRIPDQYRGLCQIIEDQTVDLAMTDVGFYGNFPLLLQSKPRPPLISCGVTAPGWHDPGSSVLTGPDNTPDGRKRNIEDNRREDEAFAPGYRHIDAVLEKLGVVVPGGYNTNTRYRLPDLFLQFGAESFEYPMYDMPENLRFVGPILHKHQSSSSKLLDRVDLSRPLVFITQGTLANYDFNRLINPAIKGLVHESVQLVVTAGGGNPAAIVAPPSVIVEPYVPYEILLPRTSVFVTNGGYNGVQQALSYGVPVVSVGVSEDKGKVSDRLNWCGAGIGLKTGNPTAEQIRDAVREVLQNDIYRKRAKILGESIAKTDAFKIIGEIVGNTVRSGRF